MAGVSDTFDFHNYAKRLSSARARLKRANICQRNIELIEKFLQNCIIRGLSPARATFYLDKLITIAKTLKTPFDQATKEDIERVVGQIETRYTKEWTKYCFKLTIRIFYRWLEGKKEYPEKVAWIRLRSKIENRTLPEELLTPEEVQKMIQHATRPRDKAFIAMLYETGTRIGEIARIKLKHIQFDEYGAVVIVNGKTGMRRIRIVSSIDYLNHWLDYHPDRNNPEAYLWVTNWTNSKGRPLGYNSLHEILVKAARKAGIRKRVNPHSFRHAAATRLANHLTEAQMNAYFGWIQGSDMPSTYVHLSGRDIDNTILQLHGIVPKESDDNRRRCGRCGHLNPDIAKYCEKCGMPLTIVAAVGLEEKNAEFERKIGRIMELLERDDVRQLIAKKLNESASQS